VPLRTPTKRNYDAYESERIQSLGRCRCRRVAISLLNAGKIHRAGGQQALLRDRPEAVEIAADGIATTKAFGWESMGIPPENGIKYRLEKDGRTLQEGRLRPVLRVKALFLPPIVGIIMVPTGLNPDITYDLVTGKQE